jgi:hypothetical protein
VWLCVDCRSLGIELIMGFQSYFFCKKKFVVNTYIYLHVITKIGNILCFWFNLEMLSNSLLLRFSVCRCLGWDWLNVLAVLLIFSWNPNWQTIALSEGDMMITKAHISCSKYHGRSHSWCSVCELSWRFSSCEQFIFSGVDLMQVFPSNAWVSGLLIWIRFSTVVAYLLLCVLNYLSLGCYSCHLLIYLNTSGLLFSCCRYDRV